MLGASRFQLEMQTSAPCIAGDVLAPGEVGDVDLDRRLQRVDAHLAIAAKGDGTDVAGRNAVRFNHVDDGSRKLLGGVRQRHAIDLRGVDQARHVLRQAEDSGAVRLGVAADTLEDRRAVVDHMRHDVDLRLVPGDELSVVPDVSGSLQGHSCAPEEL